VAFAGVSRRLSRPGKQEVASGCPGASHAVARCVSTKKTMCRLCKKPPGQRRFLGGFQTAKIWQYLWIETFSRILRN
jgi:hypothetical protein